MNFDAYIPVLNGSRIFGAIVLLSKMIRSPRFKSSLTPGFSLTPFSLLWPPNPFVQLPLRPKISTFLFSLTQNITLHFVSLAKAELACSGCASLSSLATSDWLFRKLPPMRSRVSSHVRESWGSAGRFAGRPALGRCPGRSARAG